MQRDHMGRGGHGHGRSEGFGGHGHGRGVREWQGEGGRERMFEQGDVKLLVLSLLRERPHHGYEIIKEIQELAGGEYSPSPGVIYPTLTLLEEMGLAEALEAQGGKKQYRTTSAGEAQVEEQRATLERIRARLGSAGTLAHARHAPELQRSMQNFKMALRLRLSQGEPNAETLRRVADIIDRAAVDIERS